MSLFRKIFSSVSKSDNPKKISMDSESSRYMPEMNLPVDERFMINFKQNGGKFLYCDSHEEVLNSFDQILLENDWYEKEVCCFDLSLQHKFDGFNLKFKKDTPAAFFFSGCEYLIANNGAILISSHQIKEKKLVELPDNFIIIAATSQIINDIGGGLKGIKEKNKSRIPTNITTIKNFEPQKEKDFLSYGNTTKNLYLLLLEDL